MKNVYFTGIFLAFAMMACGQNSSIKQVSSKEFKELISQKKGTLLDVRTYSEFSNGHINDAGQLNFYALDFKQKLLLLPKNQPIYLYCNTGYRSEKAAKILLENAYKNVYNLEHGIMEWNLKNYPITVNSNAKPDVENLLNKKEFSQLINSESLVFIDFYAPWCAPCRKMMPMIDELKSTYQDYINMVKINADASKSLIKELKIESVPYLVLYYKGKIVYSHYGLIEKDDLTKIFKKHISEYGNKAIK